MSRRDDTSSRSGNISPEFALLGFLLSGPQHGYDLHRRFTVELGHVWHLSQSQAYATLKRLEHQGAISSRPIPQRKLPPRQVLQITRLGRRRFNDWLLKGAGTNARSVRLEFLTRLYFVQQYKPDKATHIRRVQRAAVKARIERLQEMISQLPSSQAVNRLSLQLRRRQMELILDWMDEIDLKKLRLEKA